MRKSFLHIIFLLVTMIVMGSCYHSQRPSILRPVKDMANKLDTMVRIDSAEYIRQLDTLNFEKLHHYGKNFNFVVREDSIVLFSKQPVVEVSDFAKDSFSIHIEPDSFTVRANQRLVVADMRIISNDTIDSVWVHLISDEYQSGWIHESALLKGVDPDDPISQFISTFSNQHLIIFLVIIVIISVGYFYRRQLKKNSKIVHFNDIRSFYPTLLVLTVSASATFYASIQLFAPEMWREFYFHPSLNPFSEPLLLALFLCSVWALLIIALATIDEVRRLLSFEDAFFYLCGLVAMCAVDYIIFSVSTLYYIGYPLLVVYCYVSVKIWHRKFL
jgi:hypothetical protein